MRKSVELTINGVKVLCSAKDALVLLGASQANGNAGNGNASHFLTKADIKGIEASSAQELVLKALEKSGGRAVHVVNSGLNDALRERFNVNPREVTEAMKAKGLIDGRPSTGGFSIFIPKKA